MSDPFDVLKNADPGRDLGSPAEHWRIRERIIVDSVTNTDTNTGARGSFGDRPRWIAAMASVLALVAGTALLSNTLGGGLPTIALGQGGQNAARLAEGDSLSSSMWMGNFVFTLADGVDIPAGTADVWRWPQADRGDARAIARRVGAEGDLERVPADWGGGWQIMGDDGQTVILTVSSDGSWYWWDPAANPWTTMTRDCIEPAPAPDATIDDTDADAKAYEGCMNVEPPAARSLPSDSEARAAARELLSDGATVKVTDVYRDKWSVWVTAEYSVEGIATGQFASVGLGDNGALMTASGQWGSPEKVGAYPTISARDAVERLMNGPFPYGPAVMAARGAETGAVDDMAVVGGDSSVSSDGTSGDSAGGAGSAPGESEPVVPDELPPLDEPIEMEDIEVLLVKVEMSHTTYYGADNVRWLLPSYTYTDSDGGTWTALAIDEKYLGTEPPATTVPEPTDTTVVPEPEPEPTDPTSTVPEPTEPTDTTVAKPEETEGGGQG